MTIETESTMKYTRDGDIISCTFSLVDHSKLILKAASVKKTATGTHATIYISRLNGSTVETVLAWDYMNVERDTDRTRLSNSASKHLAPPLKEGIEAAGHSVKQILDNFCSGLWSQQLEKFLPEELSGAEEFTRPSYLVEPYVIDGGGTMLFGPPGKGKSFVAYLVAVSVHYGLNKLWPVQQRDTLLVNLERSKFTLEQRLGRINQFMGLPRSSRITTLNARGYPLLAVADTITKFIKNNHIGFLVLDSISRAGFGSMVKDEDINRCVDCLNGFGIPYLALGHTSRGSDEHIYGGILYDAGADIMVQLITEQQNESTLGIKLTVTKGNDVPTGRNSILTLEFDELGFKSIRKARDGEFPELVAKKKTTLYDDVVAYLGDVTKASATQIAKATEHSRQKVSSLLNANNDTFSQLERDGHEVVYGLKD